MTAVTAYLFFLVLFPIIVLAALAFGVRVAVFWAIEQLDHLDPMPWHQAALLGVALFVMLCLAVIGGYTSW